MKLVWIARAKWGEWSVYLDYDSALVDEAAT